MYGRRCLCVYGCVCVCVCARACVRVYSSVLYLLKELVGWVLIAILLHLGQVALLGGDGSIHLEETQREVGEVTQTHTQCIVTCTQTF